MSSLYLVFDNSGSRLKTLGATKGSPFRDFESPEHKNK